VTATTSPSPGAPGTRAAAAGIVLTSLMAAQFLMTLDTSVLNVSIATVAEDVGTTVTGVQTAITLYALVMAAFTITGGKLGTIWGRKRAFTIGLVVYCSGSAVTAVAPNLTVLILGWSVLEGLGAALILPAIVGLVAANFDPVERRRAYGLVASASAIAVAVGPLVGGVLTTYASWRYVFAGEVVLGAVIYLLARRTADSPVEAGQRLDPLGTALSALGLTLIVYGILRSGSWGLVRPTPDAPAWFGLSPVLWLFLGGGIVLLGFGAWERRRLEGGGSALVDPELLRVAPLRSGLIAFFFQYLVQMGMFFVIPLYLSVALGLSAVATGVRLLPLSVALLVAAVGIPRLLPHASPRAVVRTGFLMLFGAIVVLIALLEVGSGPEIVTWPLLIGGLGAGALASQLGSVTVSSVAEARSAEVGGLENTAINLGSSVGTALAGAVLISALTASFLGGLSARADVPAALTDRATVELSAGVPFVSDDDVRAALADADVAPAAADAVVEANADARITGLRAGLGVLGLCCLLALFFQRAIPQVPAGEDADPGQDADPGRNDGGPRVATGT
jgi:MFS family permease